jgi:hypothetical protein
MFSGHPKKAQFRIRVCSEARRLGLRAFFRSGSESRVAAGHDESYALRRKTKVLGDRALIAILARLPSAEERPDAA